MISIPKNDAKIRGFENILTGQHQTSLYKTMFSAINKEKPGSKSMDDLFKEAE